MLKGISPLLSPELLAALCRMGHGDELILADAHFPAYSCGPPVLRADGCTVTELLRASLPLLELDSYVATPVALMDLVPGDTKDDRVQAGYREVLDELAPGTPDFEQVERFAFYTRAAKAFVIVQTGDTRKYANLVLRKGVTPV